MNKKSRKKKVTIRFLVLPSSVFPLPSFLLTPLPSHLTPHSLKPFIIIAPIIFWSIAVGFCTTVVGGATVGISARIGVGVWAG
jgi:nitrate reductase NapE component